MPNSKKLTPNSPQYLRKILGMFGSSVVALWPQNELSGAVSKDISGHGYNGAYSGVTLGAAGIGDGNSAVSYDGTNSFDNIAAVAPGFNPLAGTFLIPAKMSAAGVWTDAATRYIFRLGADASNGVNIRKTSTDNRLTFEYVAGGTSKAVNSTAFGGSTVWMMLAISWDKAADAVKAYGCTLGSVLAQLGTTQTSLGVWSGTLAATLCCIGSLSTGPSSVHSGSIGPVTLLNRAATLAELQQAATV